MPRRQRPLDDVDGSLPLVGELLAAGREVRLRVTGRSMAPRLREGDTVTLRRFDPGAATAGDVLLVRGANGQLLLHRVVGRVRSGDGLPRLLLKGDALPAADEPVEAAQVVGAAVAVERVGGDGSRRTFDLTRRPVRVRGRLLALASLRFPRVFRALSVRLARP